MFFLVLRPMTWDEFIGSMVTLQIKYRFSSFPQPRPQVRITALPNGVGHLPALWRTKGCPTWEGAMSSSSRTLP